jgi:uncharacterized protein YqfB (UPF0267 family)
MDRYFNVSGHLSGFEDGHIIIHAKKHQGGFFTTLNIYSAPDAIFNETLKSHTKQSEISKKEFYSKIKEIRTILKTKS